MTFRFEPQIHEFQLLGDSQLLRFAEHVLCMPRKKKNGDAFLGLCVSGQSIMNLLNRIQEGFYPTSDKIILMIGTNDLLQFSSAECMIGNMKSLIEELKKRVVKLIILTIPPIPRLAENYMHWVTIRKFNNYLKSLNDGRQIFVVDAYSKFIKHEVDKSNSNSVSPFSTKKKETIDYFEHFYSSSIDSDNGIDSHSSCETETSTDGMVSKDADVPGVLFSELWESYDVTDGCSSTLGIGEKIEVKFFEKCFLDGKTDLIHLNLNGLNILKEMISSCIGSSLMNGVH